MDEKWWFAGGLLPNELFAKQWALLGSKVNRRSSGFHFLGLPRRLRLDRCSVDEAVEAVQRQDSKDETVRKLPRNKGRNGPRNRKPPAKAGGNSENNFREVVFVVILCLMLFEVQDTPEVQPQEENKPERGSQPKRHSGGRRGKKSEYI